MSKRFKVIVTGTYQREPIFVEADSADEARELADASMGVITGIPDVEVFREQDPDGWIVATPNTIELEEAVFLTASEIEDPAVAL
jgi:hypothetical protein